MEEEDEEARALLGDRPDGDSAVRGSPRALPALCDPSHLAHRLVVLLLMCFLGFGSYFCYDSPSALQTQVKQDMQVNTTKFMLLYAWYSWPNVVLCFLGGFLIDRIFGIRWGTVIFSCLVCVGQVIFALGGIVNAFLADGVWEVCVWGSTVSMNLMGWLYTKIETSLGAAGHLTLGVTLMIVLAYLDRRAEKILHKEQGKTGEVIKLTDIKDFSLPLWLIFLICVCYYAAVFPFIGLGKVFFIEKFGFSPQSASAINSIVYVISAPMSPVFGLLVDKTGKNLIWVLCAVATTLLSHMMLAFTFWNPWIAMCLLGLSYSLLACALWPMVAFVVPEHQLGTAYGFMQSIQNLGLAVISILAGMILDSRGYLLLEVFFIACVSLALLAVVCLYLVNRARGGNLNYSAKQREELKLSHTE